MYSKVQSSNTDLESDLQKSIEKISLDINDYFSDTKELPNTFQTLKKKPPPQMGPKPLNSNFPNPSKNQEIGAYQGELHNKFHSKNINFEPLPKISALNRVHSSHGFGKVRKMMQSIEAGYLEKIQSLKEIRNKAQDEMISIKERINKEKKGKLEHLLLNRKNRFNVPNQYIRGFSGFKKNLFLSFGRSNE